MVGLMPSRSPSKVPMIIQAFIIAVQAKGDLIIDHLINIQRDIKPAKRINACTRTISPSLVFREPIE